MPAIELTSKEQLKEQENQLVVLDFWAEWCKPCRSMNTLFDTLAETYMEKMKFFKVNAEQLEEVTEKFGVTAVPSFVFIKNGKVFDKIEGADGAQLTQKIIAYSEVKESGTKDLKSRLEKLINLAPVMLFMKGNPEQPQCGFSSKIVDLLKKEGIEFQSFDILTDNEVRQGLKEYSNWPTYPQLYIEGKLIGGLDVVKELAEEGQLVPLVPSKKQKGDLNSRLKQLINSSSVMLFMKGTPEQPQCGFSSKMVEILQKEGIKFNSFNILTNEEVRQGLKSYSNWPTYPQLYHKGKLIGGLDIVKELMEEGGLEELKE